MDLEKIREFFKDDKYAMYTGANIDKADIGYAECSMQITDMHFNAGGVVQGGAIFTLADFAFAVASNAEAIMSHTSTITVNQSSSISFIAPPKGDKITAKAEAVSRGKKISVYKIVVLDGYGNLVADMIGNGYTINK